MKTRRNMKLATLVLVVTGSTAAVASAGQTRVVPGFERPKTLGVHATFIRLDGLSRPQLRTNLLPPEGDEFGYPYGERIDSVNFQSPAHRAGLERGDIIVATVKRTCHGEVYVPIHSRRSLRNAINSSGRRLKLIVMNVRNGDFVPVTVRFDDRGSRPLFNVAGQ